MSEVVTPSVDESCTIITILDRPRRGSGVAPLAGMIASCKCCTAEETSAYTHLLCCRFDRRLAALDVVRGGRKVYARLQLLGVSSVRRRVIGLEVAGEPRRGTSLVHLHK